MKSRRLAASGIAAFNYRTTLAEDFALPYTFAAYGDTVLPEDDTALAVRIAYSYVNTVTFTYDGSKWTCNYSFPQLSSWDLSTVGVTYPEGETPVADETITVDGYGHCLVFATKTPKEHLWKRH